ncbi:MAG: pyridoxal-phosphate dependent enzyme [Erysipelotrichaceae bacterium]|nr:pyridoxal-phosphate dependent enzyme [Erysipelotrichaceae bacterium]
MSNIRSFHPTIIQQLNDFHDNKIFMKREDLLPLSFGGNKVRIAMEYIADMKAKGYDTLIGYGNTRSNLCRVLSNIACKEKIPCYIVSPADDDGQIVPTNNSFLSQNCDAQYVYCQKNNVALTISNLMKELKEKILKPYYINGNEFGTGNETVPVNAYYKVYEEICNQEQKLNIKYDYIFVALGTGMTYSGLISGKIANNDSSHNIIGISIARNTDQCREKIESYASKFLDIKGIDISEEELKKNINISDEFLLGGYSKYNSEIKDTITRLYQEEGVYADTTYVGKAYYGMKKFIEKNNIVGKNILFIHTGSTPLFFDKINEIFGD